MHVASLKFNLLVSLADKSNPIKMFFRVSPLIPRFLTLIALFCLVFSHWLFADSKTPPADKVMQEVLEEEYSPYSDNPLCDEDDDDEGLPENLMETMHSNARMAFMFGQYEVAFKAWLPLAEEGYAKSQAALAWMYHTGNGVKRDRKLAVSWYRKAAEQGHAIAQNNLAAMYENGQGTKVNEKAAVYWYRESARSGYALAQYNLGRMYAEGRGVKQDENEAKYWWRIASRQNIKQATEALALMEKRPVQVKQKEEAGPAIAHAPYHSNPVAKGLAWIEKQQRTHYTIQLAQSDDAAWILKLAATKGLDDVLVQFKTKNKKGEELINLIYGSFSSYQDAEQARRSLPASLKKWSPWLRRFGEINAVLLK
jgi:septal ring-binding cell division protein DamX